MKSSFQIIHAQKTILVQIFSLQTTRKVKISFPRLYRPSSWDNDTVWCFMVRAKWVSFRLSLIYLRLYYRLVPSIFLSTRYIKIHCRFCIKENIRELWLQFKISIRFQTFYNKSSQLARWVLAVTLSLTSLSKYIVKAAF